MNLSTNRTAKWIVDNIADTWYKLFLIGVLILSLGILVEYIKLKSNSGSETNAFSRSGSLLVATAIFFVFINHVVRSLQKSNSEFISQWDKPKNTLNSHLEFHMRNSAIRTLGKDVLDRSLKANPNLIKTSAEKASETIETDVSKRKEELDKYQKAQNRIALTELSAGVIGTLVWGYGDLLL